MEAVVMEEAAVMEEASAVESGAGKPWAERGSACEARAAEMAAGKMPAAAHGSERHAATMHTAKAAAVHAAEASTMHAAPHGASKATTVAATETAAAAMPATTTAAASGKGRGCERNADSERRRRETREKPVLHEILPDWDRGEPRIAAHEHDQKTQAQARLQLTNAPDSDAGFRIGERVGMRSK